MSCRDCESDSDHCHDVLIVHTDGWLECAAGAGCVARFERHTWRVGCDELGGCACGDVGSHAA